jgi:integrase
MAKTKVKGIIKRGERYRVLIRRKDLGKPICKTFGSLAEAERFKRNTETKIDGGEDPSAGLAMTLAEAIAHFRDIRAVGNPVRKGSSLDCRLKNLEAALGTRRVGRLSLGAVREYCEERLHPAEGRGVTKATTLGEVTTLGTVMSEVATDLQLTFPALVNRSSRRQLSNSYRVIGPAQERDRRPEEGELERVLQHLPKRYHGASRFAAVSAMRRGEVVRLRWSDLHRKDETILCRQRKHPVSNKDMTVPLLLGAYSLLIAQPHVEGQDRIFPVDAGEWSKAWRAACVAAGVEDLHLHDLRHEAISCLFEAGYEIQEVAAVSGHRSWQQLRRYTNLRPKDLKHGPAKTRHLKVVPAA